MPFSLGKWAIGLGIDLMGWALEFQMAEALSPAAGLLARVYDASLVGPLGLRHLAWTLALLVGGWHLMRARAAQGLSEVATTFVTAALGAILLANPQGYLEGAIALAQNTSGAVLEAVDGTLGGGSGQDADAVRDRLSDILRRSFVAEPYDLIDWGHALDGECAAARDQILEEGPWGSDDEPRDIMRAHGCDREADFNAEPTDSRAVGSLIVGGAAVIATVLLVAVALVVFVAQLTLVALFAGASLIWALALFPGARDLLWWWIGRLVWAVAATVAATFILSWLAVTVTVALAASSDMSIIQRSLVALLVVLFGFRLRGQLGRALEHASRRFGDSIGRVVQHAHNRWPGAAGAGAGGGSGGFGLSQMARSWSQDVPGGRPAYHLLYMYGYSRFLTRAMHRGSGSPGTIRRTIQQVGAADRRMTDAGISLARGVGRAARTVAMAPVLGPQAYVSTRTRATAASRRARVRLQRAQTTRQQWVHNVAHPVETMRAAHRESAGTHARRSPRRPPPARSQPPPAPPRYRQLAFDFTEPRLPQQLLLDLGPAPQPPTARSEM